MTKATLASRVKFWQRRLAPLGLGHWKIEVDLVDDPKGKPGSAASVTPSGYYDSALIEFARESVRSENMDVLIIHELLHLVFRDFDEAVYAVREKLSFDTAEQWNDRVDHEAEGVIERIARTLIETAKVP